MIGLNPDSAAIRVSLPDLWRSDFDKLYEVGRFSSYTCVVSHDSGYYRIFSRYHKDSLPVFDFVKQELLVAVICPQCLITCNHGNWKNDPCHRNACSYRSFWYVREKKINQ